MNLAKRIAQSLKPADQRVKDADQVARKQFPKLMGDFLREQLMSGAILSDFKPDDFSPKAMERLAVYKVLSNNGPDIDMYSRQFAMLVAKVRRMVPNLLQDFESNKGNKIYQALEQLGMFGAKSDRLRGDGDKYYPYGAEDAKPKSIYEDNLRRQREINRLR